MEKQKKDTNEELVKLLSLIKMLSLDTLQDIDKLNATLDGLELDLEERDKMLMSLEKHLAKVTRGKEASNADIEIFYSYEEALDHFFTHIYKSFVKTVHKDLKRKFYRSKSEYEAKKTNLSEAKMHQLLDLAGYDIVYVDKAGIRISYSKVG